MTDTNLLTRKQLAGNLHVSERTIRRLEIKGLPVIRVTGKNQLYDYQDVLYWLKRNIINEAGK